MTSTSQVTTSSCSSVFNEIVQFLDKLGDYIIKLFNNIVFNAPWELSATQAETIQNYKIAPFKKEDYDLGSLKKAMSDFVVSLAKKSLSESEKNALIDKVLERFRAFLNNRSELGTDLLPEMAADFLSKLIIDSDDPYLDDFSLEVYYQLFDINRDEENTKWSFLSYFTGNSTTVPQSILEKISSAKMRAALVPKFNKAQFIALQAGATDQERCLGAKQLLREIINSEVKDKLTRNGEGNQAPNKLLLKMLEPNNGLIEDLRKSKLNEKILLIIEDFAPILVERIVNLLPKLNWTKLIDIFVKKGAQHLSKVSDATKWCNTAINLNEKTKLVLLGQASGDDLLLAMKRAREVWGIDLSVEIQSNPEKIRSDFQNQLNSKEAQDKEAHYLFQVFHRKFRKDHLDPSEFYLVEQCIPFLNQFVDIAFVERMLIELFNNAHVKDLTKDINLFQGIETNTIKENAPLIRQFILSFIKFYLSEYLSGKSLENQFAKEPVKGFIQSSILPSAIENLKASLFESWMLSHLSELVPLIQNQSSDNTLLEKLKVDYNKMAQNGGWSPLSDAILIKLFDDNIERLRRVVQNNVTLDNPVLVKEALAQYQEGFAGDQNQDYAIIVKHLLNISNFSPKVDFLLERSSPVREALSKVITSALYPYRVSYVEIAKKATDILSSETAEASFPSYEIQVEELAKVVHSVAMQTCGHNLFSPIKRAALTLVVGETSKDIEKSIFELFEKVFLQDPFIIRSLINDLSAPLFRHLKQAVV